MSRLSRWVSAFRDSPPNKGVGAERLSEAIIATIAQPLLVLDRDLRVQAVNLAFLRIFEVAEDDTSGRLVYELGNGEWDIPELRRLLETIIPHNEHVEGYVVEHEFPGIGRRVMVLNARRIEGEDQRPHLILLAINDVTTEATP
jgi:PAS domain-containing protein